MKIPIKKLGGQNKELNNISVDAFDNLEADLNISSYDSEDNTTITHDDSKSYDIPFIPISVGLIGAIVILSKIYSTFKRNGNNQEQRQIINIHNNLGIPDDASVHIPVQVPVRAESPDAESHSSLGSIAGSSTEWDV